tara:strand:+ start:5683 stop:5871 length:189 start_codon:yes stop_codon:yes gene_type:complete
MYLKGKKYMKVHLPNKEVKIIDDVLTQLYLMKAAVKVEKTDKLLERIDKIRKILLKFKENDI